MPTARKKPRIPTWSESELAAVHAEYLSGVYASCIAKRRGRTAGDLLFMFRWRGWEILDKKAPVMPPRIDSDLVAAMHADYQSGMTFAQVERKYGRPAKSIRTIFLHRGLPIREARGITEFRRSNGCFAPLVPKTEEEIEALIQAATRIIVPEELRQEWRGWPLAKRGDFIRRLRERVSPPLDRPKTPFSANVIPFDYSSPEAWEIINAGNAGLASRSAAFNIKVPSQGVIYERALWFWSGKGQGYYQGKWREGSGRPALHRYLYSKHHGPVPPHHAVCMADGNFNNLDPSNLVATDRNDILRVNQATALTRKSREKTALLLARSQRKNQSNDLIKQLTPD